MQSSLSGIYNPRRNSLNESSFVFFWTFGTWAFYTRVKRRSGNSQLVILLTSMKIKNKDPARASLVIVGGKKLTQSKNSLHLFGFPLFSELCLFSSCGEDTLIVVAGNVLQILLVVLQSQKDQYCFSQRRKKGKLHSQKA